MEDEGLRGSQASGVLLQQAWEPLFENHGITLAHAPWARSPPLPPRDPPTGHAQPFLARKRCSHIPTHTRSGFPRTWLGRSA